MRLNRVVAIVPLMVAEVRPTPRRRDCIILVEVDNRRRLAELSGHEQIKSLREEIGLVRMLIEKHLNAAQGNLELLTSCGSSNQLIVTLTKLVKECHALEQSCGELLSKQTVYRLAQTMCEIVMEELQGD